MAQLVERLLRVSVGPLLWVQYYEVTIRGLSGATLKHGLGYRCFTPVTFKNQVDLST